MILRDETSAVKNLLKTRCEGLVRGLRLRDLSQYTSIMRFESLPYLVLVWVTRLVVIMCPGGIYLETVKIS